MSEKRRYYVRSTYCDAVIFASPIVEQRSYRMRSDVPVAVAEHAAMDLPDGKKWLVATGEVVTLKRVRERGQAPPGLMERLEVTIRRAAESRVHEDSHIPPLGDVIAFMAPP